MGWCDCLGRRQVKCAAVTVQLTQLRSGTSIVLTFTAEEALDNSQMLHPLDLLTCEEKTLQQSLVTVCVYVHTHVVGWWELHSSHTFVWG